MLLLFMVREATVCWTSKAYPRARALGDLYIIPTPIRRHRRASQHNDALVIETAINIMTCLNGCDVLAASHIAMWLTPGYVPKG